VFQVTFGFPNQLQPKLLELMKVSLCWSNITNDLTIPALSAFVRQTHRNALKYLDLME